MNATVDCTNYVTQLLRRLARRDYNTQIQPDEPGIGEYPIDHSAASWWNDDRREEVNHLEDDEWWRLNKGDLVTMDPSPGHTIHHVMIFVEMVYPPLGFVGPLPSEFGEYDYEYQIWESTIDTGIVSLRTRTGNSRTHFRQWIDNVVFRNCD